MKIGGNISGEHVWFIQSLSQDLDAGRKALGECVDEVMESVPDGASLILSAENLSSQIDRYQLFRDVQQKYEVRVILYIRRQDELLMSSWQQWYSKLTDDFWSWMLSAVGQIGNWQLLLQSWESIVPRSNITVRVYERSQLAGGDVNVDFLSALGLEDKRSGFEFSEDTVNPSYSEAVVELLKGNQLLFKDIHDNEAYNLIGRLTGDVHRRRSSESSITFKQRLAILRWYALSNAWVKKTYFPEQKRLFEPPLSKDYTFLGPDTLRDQEIRVLTDLVFSLAKQVTGAKGQS
jgi:hypothetical protein